MPTLVAYHMGVQGQPKLLLLTFSVLMSVSQALLLCSLPLTLGYVGKAGVCSKAKAPNPITVPKANGIAKYALPPKT